MKAALSVLVTAALCTAAQDVTVTWSVPVGDIVVTDGPFGQGFSLPGASSLAHPGEPAMPALPLYVALPQGTRAVSVTLDDCVETSLAGTYDVGPMQRGVPISRPWEFVYTPPDPSAWRNSGFRPVIELTGTGGLMGYPVAQLVFRPVAWDPASGRASLRTSVTFTVHCEPSAVVSPRFRSAGGEATAADIVRAAVVNPWQVGSSGAAIVSSDDLPYGEYLIITPQAYVPFFEPLAEFKTTIGVPASIVTVEYITANYSGVDQAQEIRFFLRDIYDEGPPTYVLLGGDVNQVDARNCWATAEGYVGDPAADIYYMDMNDTAVGADAWDHDGDGTWGEIGQDLMDYHPDYLVGRAACGSSSEVTIFVNKVLDYQIPSVDTRDTDPWYTSMGFTTAILWYSPYCPGSAGKEKVDTLYTPPAWQPVIKHYEENGTQSYELTMAMLNRGMHLVNHSGHGSETLVSIGPDYLQNSDFMGLTNISAHGRVSIWNTIACLSGSFDNTECLAEAWINSPNGGGFCMMNTRYGWGEPADPGNQWSELVDQQFFAEFFTEDMYHLGAAHAMAWDQFVALIPSDTHYDWIAKSITLFGDPELPMWLQEPDGALQMSLPPSVPAGASQLLVTLADAGGPVQDGRICVLQGEWDSPAQYVIGYTNSSGQALLSLNTPSNPPVVKVSAWARDHAPVTVEVPVGGTGVPRPDQGPAEVFLGVPVPNPAVSSVSLSWSVPAGAARLDAFDLSGRIVWSAEGALEGSGTLCWDLRGDDGSRVPSGIYTLRMSGISGGAVRHLVVLE